MEEITDTDTDGRNDDQKVPRREVLSNMGWLGALLAGLTQISTTEATSITEEVTQVADKVVRKTGDERQATLDRALDDDDVEAFRDRFQEEGKQPLFDDATVVEVDDENGEFSTVILPFRDPASQEEETFVVWTSLRSRERPTVGFQVEKHEPATGESHRDITVLMRSPEDGEINGAFKIETT